jgi:hypothetical protein
LSNLFGIGFVSGTETGHPHAAASLLGWLDRFASASRGGSISLVMTAPPIIDDD